MNTYAHLVIADEMQLHIQPDNLQEYGWGAIAPDVRNVAGMRRSQTHLSSEQILAYMVQYPDLKSFLQGYLVHCLTDELDLMGVFEKKFPFYLFKKKLTAQHYPIILEIFYIEHKPIKAQAISGRYNPVLDELGITATQSQTYSKLVSEYIAKPSFEAGIILVQKLGVVNKEKVDRYLVSAKRFQANRTMKGLVFLGIRIGKIHNQLVKSVLSAFSLSKYRAFIGRQ